MLVKRIVAFLIDGLIIGIPIGIIEFAFSIVRFILNLIPILNLFSFLFYTSFLMLAVYCLYETFCQYFFNRTLGKMIMGIHVEGNDGARSLPLSVCFVRGLAKSASMNMLWGIPALISAIMAFNDPHTSLHDIAAGTKVWE